MNTITIKQLMEIHEAITQAMRAMDHAEMNDCGESWHGLSQARGILRAAIDNTEAAVEILDGGSMDQFEVPTDPKKPFSYLHAGKLLGGISLPSVYDLMYSGLLTTVSIGRRRFVTMESVEACRKALATDVGQEKLAQRKAAKTRSGNR